MTDDDRNRISVAVDEFGALKDAGNVRGALALLQAAVDRYPSSAHLRAHAGRLHYLVGGWQSAVRELDASLLLQPDAPSALAYRGLAHSMLGALDVALDDFSRCVELQPDAADAMYEAAMIHEYRGHLREAIHWYRMAGAAGDEGYRDARDRVADLEERV